MNEFPLHRLLELVKFDQLAHKERIELKKVTTEVDQLEKQVDRNNEQLEMVKNKWQEARHEVAVKELEMQELDEAEKKANTRLENLQDSKEYHAIKKEIEHLKNKQHDFEQTLLAVWHDVEVAERDYKTKQAAHDEEIKNLQTAIAEKRKQLDEKEKLVATFEGQRIEKIQNIPEQWLEKYERMQSRVPNPVVPVTGDSCGGCFFKIPAQDMMQLRNRALLQCKNCYRFLYLESAMQQGPA